MPPSSAKVYTETTDPDGLHDKARRASAILSGGITRNLKKGSVDMDQLLRRAFTEMDADGSGKIEIDELRTLLVEQGHNQVTREHIVKAMKKLDRDGDPETLCFDEFKHIMSDMNRGAGLEDVLQHFGKSIAHGLFALAEESKPIWEQIAGDAEDGELTAWQHFQIKAGGFLDGAWAQLVFLILIAIDVICVVIELVILHTACDFCHAECSTSQSRHLLHQDFHSGRLLASAPPSFPPVNCTAGVAGHSGVTTQVCTTMLSPIQYDWEHWLHIVSVSILGIFGLQLFLLMILYQMAFFKNLAYIVDTIVVGAALVLENLSSAKEGGLFVVLLSWRVLRIVHGIISAVELQEGRAEEKAAEHGVKLMDKHYMQASLMVQTMQDKAAGLKLETQQVAVQKQIDEGDTASSSEQTARDFVELVDAVKAMQKELNELHSSIESDTKRDNERRASVSFKLAPKSPAAAAAAVGGT